MPPWTSDGWMTVLEGEVTQRNRSGAASWAIGPAAASPPTMRLDRRQVGSNLLEIHVGRQRPEGRHLTVAELDPNAEEAEGPAEQHDARR